MDFLEPVTIDKTDTVAGLREKIFNIMKDHYVANKD
jgi:hypothetical protein